MESILQVLLLQRKDGINLLDKLLSFAKPDGGFVISTWFKQWYGNRTGTAGVRRL